MRFESVMMAIILVFGAVMITLFAAGILPN